MGYTPTYESQVKTVRGMLSNAGQNNVRIQIGELNLAWQYNDGYKGGGETRFFTAYNTAWIASSIGHILIAGGRELVYSNQNGPLGFFVEPGNQDQGKPSGTPTPAGLRHRDVHRRLLQADHFPTFGDKIMAGVLGQRQRGGGLRRLRRQHRADQQDRRQPVGGVDRQGRQRRQQDRLRLQRR